MMEQDIRAICTGDPGDCGHLYSGGAVDTIVRLPEDVSTLRKDLMNAKFTFLLVTQCGVMHFARVAREWTHENQTIPAEVQTKIQKRDSNSSAVAPTDVRGISLDMNWAAVDPAQYVFNSYHFKYLPANDIISMIETAM